MKVRVSYNTDLEDVPDLIDGILDGCKQKMLAISNDLRIEYSNHQRTLTKMSDIRESLALIDEQIQDSVNLYTGWYNATTQPMQKDYVDVPATKEMAIEPEEQSDEHV